MFQQQNELQNWFWVDLDYLQFKQDHCFPAENTAAGIFSHLRWKHLLQLLHSDIRSPISSVLQ